MKFDARITMILPLFCIVTLLTGCETMEKGAYKTGEYTGKAVRVGDKVSEGAVDGYLGDDSANNPYNR